MTPANFAAIGECMIELSGRDEDIWQLRFAGDTFNTAWYAKALLGGDAAVAYVTALGEDPFSARMAEFFGRNGILTDRIRTVPGRRPGLYAITLQGAERSFSYWRSESAARQLADDPDWLDGALADCGTLHFSGITLAILPPRGRAQLFAALARRRAEGAWVAFDPNYRPVLWPDIQTARAASEQACRIADIVLPTFPDEAALFGDCSRADTAKRMKSYGVGEIVVKDGAEACLVSANGAGEDVPPERPERIVDTTGAGDSFGGAYLAARIMGREPVEAARIAHRVAGKIVGVRGALAEIDRAEVLAEQ